MHRINVASSVYQQVNSVSRWRPIPHLIHIFHEVKYVMNSTDNFWLAAKKYVKQKFSPILPEIQSLNSSFEDRNSWMYKRSFTQRSLLKNIPYWFKKKTKDVHLYQSPARVNWLNGYYSSKKIWFTRSRAEFHLEDDKPFICFFYDSVIFYIGKTVLASHHSVAAWCGTCTHKTTKQQQKWAHTKYFIYYGHWILFM